MTSVGYSTNCVSVNWGAIWHLAPAKYWYLIWLFHASLRAWCLKKKYLPEFTKFTLLKTDYIQFRRKHLQNPLVQWSDLLALGYQPVGYVRHQDMLKLSQSDIVCMLVGFTGPACSQLNFACLTSYRQISNIRRTKSQTSNVSHLVLQLVCPIHWSQVFSWKWRCSWSSTDRRCSNYIWVINNFIVW